MTEEISNYEKSLWTIKINNQLLYKKSFDGVTTLSKATREESEKVAEILNKAIAEAGNALAGREAKREAMAKSELDDMSASVAKSSIWSFKINSQLLYKKTVGGKTILFGMSEKEHEKVSSIMDSAITELLEVLKDKTSFREAKLKLEEITSMDPLQMAMDSLERNNGMQEEIEKAKKELEEAKKEAEQKAKKDTDKEDSVEKDSDVKIEKADITEEIKEATDNKLRDKIQDKKSSGGSFWDNLK